MIHTQTKETYMSIRLGTDLLRQHCDQRVPYMAEFGHSVKPAPAVKMTRVNVSEKYMYNSVSFRAFDFS